MQFLLKHNKSDIVIDIPDTDWSLKKVKELISKKTGIATRCLIVSHNGKEIQSDDMLPKENGLILTCTSDLNVDDFLEEVVVIPDRTDSLVVGSAFIDKDIIRVIMQLLFPAVKDVMTLSLVNLFLNRTIKHFLFNDAEIKAVYLNDKRNRLHYVGKIKDKNEIKKIKAFIKNKTLISDVDVEYYVNGKGRKKYIISKYGYNEFVFSLNYNAEIINKLLSQKGLKDIFSITEEKIEPPIMPFTQSFHPYRKSRITGSFSETQMRIFNDSTIVKKKPVIDSNQVDLCEAISIVSSCLLGDKTDDKPVIQFVQKGQQCKLFLRYTKQDDYPFELVYALKKERYIFDNKNSETNQFKEHDSHFCHNDYSIISITTSSIEINGLSDILRYIFETCDLKKEYITELFFGGNGRTQKLKRSNQEIISGFKTAFLLMIGNQLGKLHAREVHDSSCSKKIKFLEKVIEEIVYVVKPNDFVWLFTQHPGNNIDGVTFELYQKYKNIFFEIHQYYASQKLQELDLQVNHNFISISYDVVHEIAKHLLVPVHDLAMLSKVNKLFNQLINEFLFQFLQDPHIRTQINLSFAWKNTNEYQLTADEITQQFSTRVKDEKIKKFVENKTGIPVDHIRISYCENGKKRYLVKSKNCEKAQVYYGGWYGFSNTVNASFVNELSRASFYCYSFLDFESFNTQNLVTENIDGIGSFDLDAKTKSFDGVTYDCSRQVTVMYFTFDEYQKRLFNVPNLVSGKPQVDGCELHEALRNAIVYLLKEKMDYPPGVQFVQTGHGVKLFIRFKEHDDAVFEMTHALRKTYFHSSLEDSSEDSVYSIIKLIKFDVYPCEYFDTKTKKQQRFLATSSIEISELDHIFQFIFIICSLNEKYLEELFFGKENKKPILTGIDKGMMQKCITHLLNSLISQCMPSYIVSISGNPTINFLFLLAGELQNDSSYEGLASLFQKNSPGIFVKQWVSQQYQKLKTLFWEMDRLCKCQQVSHMPISTHSVFNSNNTTVSGNTSSVTPKMT